LTGTVSYWFERLSWGVRGDLLSHPAQKGQLITAHIIDIRPRKTKLLPKPGLSPAPV